MKIVAVVGGGPASYLPSLADYQEEVSIWIGADQGALSIIEQGMKLDIAVGDFDSVNNEAMRKIKEKAGFFHPFHSEKDETDLELAILEAQKLSPDAIFLFGVTGGRLDHEMANLQLLYVLKHEGINASIIDKDNKVKLFFPGSYDIEAESDFPYVSFLPLSLRVSGMTLSDFYYPLEDAILEWGSTRCISNEIKKGRGRLAFKEGILYAIQSRDPVEP